MDVVRECGEAWDRLITGKANPGDVSMYVPPLPLALTLTKLTPL